jgi:type II secretory pathway component PulK
MDNNMSICTRRLSELRRCSPRGERGSILLLALWSLCLLSFFCVILGSTIRQKVELVRRLGERDALQAANDAGVQKAIAAVKNEINKEYQWPGDPWSNDRAQFGDVDCGSATVSLTHHLQNSETDTLYGLEDEESKININRAPEPVLERLFRVCGLEEAAAQNLANSIVDWRDTDEFLSVPLGSAESSYYRSLPIPYEAKNADFELIDELLLVKGMDGNIFKIISQYITIYGTGAVNLNTASRTVLLALGLSADTADLLIEYRNGKDGLPATQDDGVFISLPGVTAGLTAAYRLSDAELTELSTLVNGGSAGVQSRYFKVSSLASMKRGGGKRLVTAVIDTTGNILSWTE